MTLDAWIEWLEIQNYNSKVILTSEQASEILKYLKELRKSKQTTIDELQEELRRLHRELEHPNTILPVPPAWKNPFWY